MRRGAPKSAAAIVLSSNPEMIDAEGKISNVFHSVTLLIKSSPKMILILLKKKKKKSIRAAH